MASSIKRNIYAFKSDDATNVKGQLYKLGSTDDHVTIVTANTDIGIGFCQDEAGQVLAVDDQMELAMIGGGAKALAGTAVTRGTELMWSATGLVPATTTLWVCAIALASGVLGDIIPVIAVGYHKV